VETNKVQNNIFSFTSLRSFLKAHADDQKAKNPTWSYGMWAKRLGLKGTASLTMVVNGQRNAGPQMVAALVEYFKFDAKQKKYFENLANLEKVQKDSSLQYLVLQELKRLSPLKNFKIFDDSTFDVISNWYHLAIKQLVRMGVVEPGSISNQLRFDVSEKQVKTALDNLEKVGLIVKAEEGYHLTNGRIRTDNDIPSEAVKRYHEQAMENAKRSVREIEVELRELQSLTFLLDTEKLKDAKERIRNFMDEFSKNVDTDEGNQVYQLNVQLFPVTKTPNKKPKEFL
jgi:uncharacterized protein (TIGR02147 family)